MTKSTLLFFLLAIYTSGFSQPTSVKLRSVYQDAKGIIRWSDDKQAVALYGANYCLPSACDYRAAGYVTNDRKKAVDQDMTHFARMGWDALRLSFWGDYENSDSLGNLVANDNLDVMDYVIYKAGQRGIYMLLSPIVTYNSKWPDAMRDTVSARGLSFYFKKSELGTNPKAIAAQQNYLRQMLNHVNPYTGRALKDEPAILFIEMINEPHHHSEDVKGSVAYINALIKAVKSTGCKKLLFHNLSQDFNMVEPLRQSDIDGISFGWYPSGLNSGRALQGNYLPAVDDFSLMLDPKLAKHSRIVYEFDTPDLQNAYLYPAMARTFRTVGAQYAAMFSYDMLITAPYNLGWQTHFLNLVYTPQKALSAIIAAEVMRQVPLYKSYGRYPENTTFGPFRINYEDNLCEMVTGDKFLYANNTSSSPPNRATLNKIVGYGSSPVVNYEGKGIYFLDKIKDGVWRLEVYPDAVSVNDPFNMPSPGKLVTRSISRQWPMSVKLPDLGGSFSVLPLNMASSYQAEAQSGQFDIRPGVYILTKFADLDFRSLPASIGALGMNEFVVLEDQQSPPNLLLYHQESFEAGKPFVIEADVFSHQNPESVTLYYKKSDVHWFMSTPMQRVSGYTYQAQLAGDRLGEGWMDYCIVVKADGKTINFPSGIDKAPDDWDYYKSKGWSSKLVNPTTPVRILNPETDIDQLTFTRIGDGIRHGVFQVKPASHSGEAAFRLSLPLSYDQTLDDYTISVPISHKISPRKEHLKQAKKLVVQLRGVSSSQETYITLVESDGTAWTKKLALTEAWQNLEIPLNELEPAKSAMLPLGYPGRWNYWFAPAAGRGKPGDRINLSNLERLQLSIRPATGNNPAIKADSWIEITSATLVFE